MSIDSDTRALTITTSESTVPIWLLTAGDRIKELRFECVQNNMDVRQEGEIDDQLGMLTVTISLADFISSKS